VFEPVDEVAGHDLGYVPHYPLGTTHSEFTQKLGIPLPAANGGKETLYPEYEETLKKLIADMAAKRAQ
jgi:hypothetical protein